VCMAWLGQPWWKGENPTSDCTHTPVTWLHTLCLRALSNGHHDTHEHTYAFGHVHRHACSHHHMVCVLIVVVGATLWMLLANASPPPSNH
jgi:hypothetical protein